MIENTGIINEDLLVEEDTRLSGIIKADIFIRSGLKVEISGNMRGNIEMDPGSHLTVSGNLWET